jgi:AcrR family transcriptional regulator
MGRPFTASDDDILQAARKVIERRGLDAFSVQEVANEVGISRAAVALRFKTTHALKVASLRKLVHQFAELLKTLPTARSGDNLLRVAALIGGYSESRESAVRFFANYYASHLRERSLLRLERQRGEALNAAIFRVMPECAIDRRSAVLAFSEHLTGTIAGWVAQESSISRRDYLVERTAEWLTLMRIPFSRSTVRELCSTPQPPSTPTALQRASTRTRRSKQAMRR